MLPQKSKRCCMCRKKTINLIQCSCGNSYCIPHRYKDIHECPTQKSDLEKEKIQHNLKLLEDGKSQSKILPI